MKHTKSPLTVLMMTALLMLSASAVFGHAQEITFNVTADTSTGDWTITKTWVGNMVDPDTCTNWRYTPPNQPNPWTWSYTTPQNDVSFGLLFQFDKTGGSGADMQTAIGCVVVNPQDLDGDSTVHVHLAACDVNGAPNNPQLRVTIASGPGHVLPTAGGQPSCKLSGATD